MNPAVRPRDGAALACAILALSLACYAAYGWTALVRLGLIDRPAETAAGVVGLVALFALGLLSPLGTTAAALMLVPFVGNHPGGRLVELINLPLAAGAAGFVVHALRRRLGPPRGALWLATGLYAASAVVALVPAIPGMWIQAAQLNAWPTALADALSAPEDNPLYSLSSAAGVTLTAAWAAAFAWVRPPVRPILRSLVYLFFLVVALGVLDYFGAISLVGSYMRRIDPRTTDVSGLQSLFWNPGWFAWYFVMLFGLAIGYLWTARPRERRVVGALLVAAYAFSFLNPQRGGLLAIHVCLMVAGWLALGGVTSRRRALQLVAVVTTAVLVVAGAYALDVIPRTPGSSLFRLFERDNDTLLSNSIRLRLWNAAFEMWRSAPVFGIGEGAFAWRFDEYVSPGSPQYTSLHGDAHSTWLQILSTRGAFGLLSFAALIWVVGGALGTAIQRTSADRGVVIALTLSFAGFLVYSAVQGMFYIHGIQILFWFLVAAAACSIPAASPAVPRWAGPVTVVALATALILQFVTSAPAFALAARHLEGQPRGFYPLEYAGEGERSWRWSAGREAAMCLQPLRQRAQMAVSSGDPRAVNYPRTVTLAIDERVVQRVTLHTPAPVTVVVTMPEWDPQADPAPAFGECTGQAHEVTLTVRVDATWNPMAEGLAPDPRTLGVQVFEPVWVDAE